MSKVCNVHRKDAYKGLFIYTGKDFNGAISLGLYIISNENMWKYNRSFTREHEWGHTKQSLYLGPLYLFTVGLVSISWNILRYFSKNLRKKSYYSIWPENWADKLGGVFMIRLFMAQNNPAKKKVNNSKIYYYGPEYYGSSSQIFLLEFDYPIANTNIDDLYVDQNVQYEVTDNTGYVHTGTARIASSYFENYDIPAYNHQYIPFTITFDDGVYFEDVEDINIINWAMTTHVDSSYSYPVPSYSTGSGPWSRIMCHVQNELPIDPTSKLIVQTINDEYTSPFNVYYDRFDNVYNTPLFVSKSLYINGVGVEVLMRTGGIEDDRDFNLHSYTNTYMGGIWTRQLQSTHTIDGYEAYDLTLDVYSSFKPIANICDFSVTISYE